MPEVTAQSSSTLPAGKGIPAKQLTSKAAIKAAMTAKIAEEKAKAKKAIEAIQDEAKALAPSITHKELSHEWQASKGNSPYMVENMHKGTNEDWLQNALESQWITWLANWAQGSYGAMLAEQAQAEKLAKAEKQLEKAKSAYAEASKVNIDEYDSKGNKLIQTNLDSKWCDLLNLMADSLTGSKAKNGKVKIDPIHMNLNKSQTHYMKQIVEAGFVVVVSEPDSTYQFTDKGLSEVFQTNWDEVKANLSATL